MGYSGMKSGVIALAGHFFDDDECELLRMMTKCYEDGGEGTRVCTANVCIRGEGRPLSLPNIDSRPVFLDDERVFP